MNQKLVLITGANGFLGKNLVHHFKREGWIVRTLVRKPSSHTDFQFDLSGERDDPKAFQCAGFSEITTIHCAHAAQGPNNANHNYEGTMRLYENTRRISNARFIYISSMAAHEGAESDYGKSKLKIEKALDLQTDAVIKPGTIIGDGGIFSRITDLVRKLPVIPIFYASKKIQTVEISDLCAMIEIIMNSKRTGIAPLAHPEATSIHEFYDLLIKHIHEKRFLLPCSAPVILPVLHALEKMKLQLPITSENLLGLKCLKYFEVDSIIRELGVQPKNYKQSLDSL